MHGSTRVAAHLPLGAVPGAIGVAGAPAVIGRVLGRWLGG